MIGYEFRDIGKEIPHACGTVLDVVKVTATKSQLVCATCRKECAVWITDDRKPKAYPREENAQTYDESTLRHYT